MDARCYVCHCTPTSYLSNHVPKSVDNESGADLSSVSLTHPSGGICASQQNLAYSGFSSSDIFLQDVYLARRLGGLFFAYPLLSGGGERALHRPGSGHANARELEPKCDEQAPYCSGGQGWEASAATQGYSQIRTAEDQR